jgi:3-hydroxymyristoyl/3-hydroxydecanoyl-(acyl carrier protein) dehydratase
MSEPAPPFQLVDRLDWYEPCVAFRGHLRTSGEEPFWEGGRMPGPLLLEALGQAANWLLLLSTDLRTAGMLVSVGSVAVHGAVRPGDVVDLEGRVDVAREDAASMSGTARVRGEIVLDARDVVCTFIDAERLEDRASLERRRQTVAPSR